MMDQKIFLILLACHWLADFTHLSRPWMLAAKANGWPLVPIAAHAGVHAILMATALAFLSPHIAIACLIIQWSTHFVIDVWKGRMNVWFPSLRSPANVFHWWVFGADQMLHIVVLVIISSL